MNLTGGITLAPGDLMIEKNNGLWGWGAKAIFSKDHQHVRVVCLDTSKTIEAIWNGVKVTDIDRASLHQYEIWRPMCSADVKAKALLYMHEHMDECYGYIQLAGLLAATRLGIEIPDLPGKTCSELAASGFARGGWDLVPMKSDSSTGPWDLRNPATSFRLA